jgi:hypothetical protein
MRDARSFIVGAMLILMLPPANGRADEKSLNLNFSGTFISTNFDANQDGVPGVLLLLEGKGNLGPFTAQGIFESYNANAPNPPSACTLPGGAGGIQLALVTGSLVMRFSSRKGDLLYAQFIPPTTNCLNPATGESSISGTSQIIGDTGKFAEATGGGQFSVSTQYLAADAQGPGSHVFGSQSGTFTGTLTLP